MSFKEFLEKVKKTQEVTLDPFFNRLNGISYEKTQELLDLLKDKEYTLGINSALRKLRKGMKTLILTNSPNSVLLDPHEGKTVVITSVNPVSLGLFFKRSELISVVSWEL